MQRPIAPHFAAYDSTLFLALAWSGGTGCDLAGIMARCDWIDRTIPSATELDGGLNRLLACGLITERNGRYRIPSKMMRQFDTFRRRRRRDRFTMARVFVESFGPLARISRKVTIRRADVDRAYVEYRRLFAAATSNIEH